MVPRAYARCSLPSVERWRPLVERALAGALDDHGSRIPVSLGLAIIHRETNGKPASVNLTGRDGERGGAHGLGQVTLRTAHAVGLIGWTAADLQTAEGSIIGMAVVLMDAWKSGAREVRDFAAVYNGGRKYARASEAAREYARWVEAVEPLYRIVT